MAHGLWPHGVDTWLMEASGRYSGKLVLNCFSCLLLLLFSGRQTIVSVYGRCPDGSMRTGSERFKNPYWRHTHPLFSMTTSLRWTKLAGKSPWRATHAREAIKNRSAAAQRSSLVLISQLRKLIFRTITPYFHLAAEINVIIHILCLNTG